MRPLESLAKLCAILAGVLLTAITLMTCVSLIGRNTIGVTIVGDFELTGVAAGAAIALFMPWCQLRRGNIIVDFFTAKASDAHQREARPLRRPAAAAWRWRCSPGAPRSAASTPGSRSSGTMMIGFPEWMVYVGHGAAAGADGRDRPGPGVRGFDAAEVTRMSPLALTVADLRPHAGADGAARRRSPSRCSSPAASATSLQAGWPPFSNFLNTQAFARFASYDLSVIPLFILMGNFATQGGISKALFEFASVVMARFHGGLAMAAVHGLRRLRRDLRLLGGHRRHDHVRRAARDETPRLLRAARRPARWPPAAPWAS